MFNNLIDSHLILFKFNNDNIIWIDIIKFNIVIKCDAKMITIIYLY